MANPSPLPNTPSAVAPIESRGFVPTEIAALAAWLQRLWKIMDPIFPAAVVEPPPDGIGEPNPWYTERPQPEFVREDNKGWIPEF